MWISQKHKNLQSWPKYMRQTLVLVLNRTLRGKVQFQFLNSFLFLLTKFSFWEEDWALGYNSASIWDLLKPIQDGLFGGCSRMRSKRSPFPKICHTYPTMMKPGTVIPYLKKTQKIYLSRDIPREFC